MPSQAEHSIDAAELASAKSEYRLLRGLLLATLWISSAIALSLNLVEPDLWGHVRYGQDWIEEGELPRTASHTFTAVDHPWVNHENLAELTFAHAYSWLGDEGLLVGKCLLGLAILGSMAWLAVHRGVRALTVSAFLLLVANNLTAYFPVRPQLLSFAWFTLNMLCIERAFDGWHDALEGNELASRTRWNYKRLVWLLPVVPLIVLWTNSHGAFVAGVAILLTYLGGRIVEVAVRHRGRALPVISMLGGVMLLVALATFVNPYGAGLHQWLLASLGSPRPEITEWAAPKSTDPVFWPFVALAVVAACCWTCTKLRRDWVQIFIVLLVAWQATQHLRHIAFFALLCGFWIPVHLQSVLLRLKPQQSGELPVMRLGSWMRWSVAGVLALLIALQSWTLYGRLHRLPVYSSMYPVEAVQYMTDHDLHGKLVVSFNWAQYAIAALSPETKVSFDGRFRTCYPQEVVDVNFDWLIGDTQPRFRRPDAGPIDPRAVLKYGAPDMVLVDREYLHAAKTMIDVGLEKDSEWTVLYQDGIAQLWGRKSRYDDPTSRHFLPKSQRKISNRISSKITAWPALPAKKPASIVADRTDEPPQQDSNL